MKEEIDEFMRKLLKNYDMFRKTPKEDIAHDMEVQFSFLRVLLGNGFNDLRAFTRAEKEVAEFLDEIEKAKKKGVK